MTRIIPIVSIKTAISLPAETYRSAEKSRKKAGKSRSALYAEALQAYLKAEEVREMEARYEAAYKAMPETAEELAETEAFMKAGLEGLEPEDWSKEYAAWCKEHDAPR